MPALYDLPRRLRFAQFEFDLGTAEIYKEGKRIKLQEQPSLVLALLIEHPGELVTREELNKKLWPNHTFVDFDHGLNIAINKLREALGDSAENPHFIETLPRRGYRWIAPVTEVQAAPVEKIQVPLRRRFAIGAAVAAVTGVLIAVLLHWNVGGLRKRMFAASAPAKIQSLAVLPLANLSGDSAQEYFSDGMTDAIITDLAQLSSLKVISRTSVMRYKKTEKRLPEIARELKVDAIVEGTVQRSGDRVHITAQLIEGATDRHLWAESFDGDLQDTMALQGDVARAIATHIQRRVAPPAPAGSMHPVQFDAYDAYLKGRYYWNQRSAKSLNEAVTHFERAITLEPTYALAYAGLADAYDVLGTYGEIPPTEAMTKCRAAARRALEIDDGLAEAHTSLAAVSFDYDWDWAQADREFRRAIELNGSYSTAHLWYASYLSAMRKPAEASREANVAIGLDPLSLTVNTHAGWISYQNRQYDQALQQFRKVMDLSPEFAPAHTGTGLVLIQRNQYAQAIAELDKVRRLSHDSPMALADLAVAYAASGQRAKAHVIADQLRGISRRRYVSGYRIALVYAALGEREQAFQWLERAYEERSDLLVYLNVDPEMGPLRKDARFEALLRRVNLPAESPHSGHSGQSNMPAS